VARDSRNDHERGVLSPRSVAHVFNALRTVFRWGVKMGLIVRNAADAVDPPRFGPEERHAAPQNARKYGGISRWRERVGHRPNAPATTLLVSIIPDNIGKFRLPVVKANKRRRPVLPILCSKRCSEHLMFSTVDSAMELADGNSAANVRRRDAE
jgi:hypothetical protein